jgi:hypothetical protein
VRIFALDERTFVAFLAVALAMAVVSIHWAVDVCLSPVACLLILAWARWVVSLHEIIRILKILSIASFVTKRPNDD